MDTSKRGMSLHRYRGFFIVLGELSNTTFCMQAGKAVGTSLQRLWVKTRLVLSKGVCLAAVVTGGHRSLPNAAGVLAA